MDKYALYPNRIVLVITKKFIFIRVFFNRFSAKTAQRLIVFQGKQLAISNCAKGAKNCNYAAKNVRKSAKNKKHQIAKKINK